MVEHLLQAADHRRGAVRRGKDALDEIRPRQVHCFLGNAFADVVQQLVGIGAEQFDDIGFACSFDGGDGWHDAILLNNVGGIISQLG